MLKPKIWIIGQYISPEQFGYHSKYHFIAQKIYKSFDILIISADKSSHHDFDLNNRESKIRVFEKVKYLLLKSDYNSNSKISKILSSIQFALKLTILTFFKRKPDIALITIPNPIIGIILLPILKISRVKVITEVRDIWPLAQKELYAIPQYHPYYIIFKLIEVFNHRFSDLIISPLKMYDKYLKDYKMSFKNYYFVPQATKIIELKSNDSSNKDVIKGIYSGDINSFCAFKEFLEAVNITSKKHNIDLTMIGGGDQLDFAKKYVKENKLKNIHFLGKTTKEELFNIMDSNKFDFAISLGPIRGKELFNNYGLSSLKILDYMNYNLPVFSTVFNSSCSDLSKELGGYFCENTDPLDISLHFDEFLSKIKDFKIRASNCRDFLLNERSIDVVSQKLEKIFISTY